MQRRPSGVTHGALCACRLAVLLGGDLHLTDREDRTRGVRYRLRLPCVPTVAPGEDAAATTTFSPQRLVPNMLLRWKVLVVDDVAGNRRLARRMLQQLGCEVIEASDGDEVVDALETAVATTSTGNIPGPPDVVLMDIEMARMDGVIAIAEMRRGGWGLTPVIAVTGHADAESAAECACARARSGSAVRARAPVLDALVRRCRARIQPRVAEAIFADAAACRIVGGVSDGNTNTNTNTKYTCDTGQTRNKLLAQWVHLTNHAAGHSRRTDDDEGVL